MLRSTWNLHACQTLSVDYLTKQGLVLGDIVFLDLRSDIIDVLEHILKQCLWIIIYKATNLLRQAISYRDGHRDVLIREDSILPMSSRLLLECLLYQSLNSTRILSWFLLLVVGDAVEYTLVVSLWEVDYTLVVADNLWNDSFTITQCVFALVDENLESSDCLYQVSRLGVVELVS
ncbi:hypothetical protein P3T76_007213 [Phytophthora citrophthora]|uniref:Uncharacterized protein n=1 Tax=Phytophthora citrophthora TaxID=4793 RepID=A0AAD9LN12_9STRA|nr:hypothetical protein P3T76_007213 [Phytophthora citrophthora]